MSHEFPDNHQEAPRVESNRESLSSEVFPDPTTMTERMQELGFSEHVDTYRTVCEMAEAIQQAGGRGLLVGGSVRDVLMGHVPKDFDMEVYNMPAEDLEQLAERFGKVLDVGKAFGILKITTQAGLDIDISLPRTDSKIDAGHRGFAVKTDPSMSIADAARRRDFTMNSVAADPLTGELYDPFGGVDDIRKRILRITDPERFRDDPLRVLRALQFVGRFGLSIDKESIPILQEMASQLKELPKERIGEEWKKLLLKSEMPSIGLSAGMMLGVMHELHPEFPPLKETPQEPEWHPEGDVWIHTLMTVDAAARIVRRERLEDNEALTALLGILCHDLGKPPTTELLDGRIKSHGHEAAGEEPTKKFLASLGIDNETRDKVVKIVTNHLIPSVLYIEESVKNRPVKDGVIRRLAKRIHPATIRELVMVAEADHVGRGPFPDPEFPDQLLLPFGDYPAGEWLLKRAREIDVEKSRPADLTRGQDWLGLGYAPGKIIGRLIQLSNDLRDEKAFTREMVLAAVHGATEPESAAQKLEELLQHAPESD